MYQILYERWYDSTGCDYTFSCWGSIDGNIHLTDSLESGRVMGREYLSSK